MQPVTNSTRLNDPVNFPGLPEAIGEAGYALEQRFPGGAWWVSDPVATQTIIDGYDPLPYARTVAIQQVKDDGLAKLTTIWPTVDSLDKLKPYADLWTSIAPAARQPNADMTSIIAIYSAAQTAISQIKAATTLAGIAAVTPAWPF